MVDLSVLNQLKEKESVLDQKLAQVSNSQQAKERVVEEARNAAWKRMTSDIIELSKYSEYMWTNAVGARGLGATSQELRFLTPNDDFAISGLYGFRCYNGEIYLERFSNHRELKDPDLHDRYNSLYDGTIDAETPRWSKRNSSLFEERMLNELITIASKWDEVLPFVVQDVANRMERRMEFKEQRSEAISERIANEADKFGVARKCYMVDVDADLASKWQNIEDVLRDVSVPARAVISVACEWDNTEGIHVTADWIEVDDVDVKYRDTIVLYQCSADEGPTEEQWERAVYIAEQTAKVYDADLSFDKSVEVEVDVARQGEPLPQQGVQARWSNEELASAVEAVNQWERLNRPDLAVHSIEHDLSCMTIYFEDIGDWPLDDCSYEEINVSVDLIGCTINRSYGPENNTRLFEVRQFDSLHDLLDGLSKLTVAECRFISAEKKAEIIPVIDNVIIPVTVINSPAVNKRLQTEFLKRLHAPLEEKKIENPQRSERKASHSSLG